MEKNLSALLCLSFGVLFVACSGGQRLAGGPSGGKAYVPDATIQSGSTAVGADEASYLARYQATDMGEAPTSLPVQFTMTLAHQDETGLQSLIQRQATVGSADFHRYLTTAQFNARFGASPAARSAVVNELEAAGFTVLPQRVGPGIVQATGTSGQAEAYFQTTIHVMRQNGSTRYAKVAPVTVPSTMKAMVVAVTGLENLVSPGFPSSPVPQSGVVSQACPQVAGGVQPECVSKCIQLGTCSTPTPPPPPTPMPTPPVITGPDGPGPCSNVPTATVQSGTIGTDTAWYNGYAPCTYAQDFDMPNLHGFSGSQSYAIGILNWTYENPSDINSFFVAMGVARTAPINDIQITNYGTGGWAPAYPTNSDWLEVTGDIEMIAALAPDATIYSYESEDGSPNGLVNAINTVVSDNLVSVLNMSFGSPEWANESAQYEYTQAFHNAISQGSAQGITFVASTGDFGLNDCGPNDLRGGQICDPASDPLVVAVGGLSPDTQNNYGVAYEQSYAWTEGGGGTSQYFAKGPSQATVCGGSMRCIPDVALSADCTKYAYLIFEGSDSGFCGTSFAANIFSAIQGEIDERQGTRKGSVNSNMYFPWESYGYGSPGLPSQGLPMIYVDITAGNNGAQAGPGWDFATGIGAPDGYGLSNVE